MGNKAQRQDNEGANGVYYPPVYVMV